MQFPEFYIFYHLFFESVIQTVSSIYEVYAADNYGDVSIDVVVTAPNNPCSCELQRNFRALNVIV